MNIGSYREYLDFLQRLQNKRFFVLKKLVLAGFVIGFISVGAYSAYFYIQEEKVTQVKTQEAYINTAGGGFHSTKQSLDELLTTFNVAGAKVKIINDLNETNDQAGYFAYVEAVQKRLALIEATKKNINTQKNLLKRTATPKKYVQLNNDILAYYSESQNLLDEIYRDQEFEKQMFLALGPKFYSSVLSNEGLWKEQKESNIIDYYKNIKEDTNSILENLSKISVPDKFREYYDAQLEYIKLLTGLSDKIQTVLKTDKKIEPDSATKLEEAYQILNNARKENDVLSKKLLNERLKVLSIKYNLERFSALRIKQNSIDAKFADLASELQQKNIPEYPKGYRLF